MTQDLKFDELIEWCKKRIVFLLTGPIYKIDRNVDAKGWKWELAMTLIEELTYFIISRDEPDKRQEILDRIVGEDPSSWSDLITDLIIMQDEGHGVLRVKYPDGIIVSVKLNLDEE